MKLGKGEEGGRERRRERKEGEEEIREAPLKIG